MQRLSPQRLVSCVAAVALVESVLAAARVQQLAVAVAVIDAAGQLKAFAADDGAPRIAHELCQRKARAALLGLPSGALAVALDGTPALMQGFLALPELSLLDGGLPLRVGDDLVGALGVGGANPDQDAALAVAAAAAQGFGPAV